MVHPKDKNKKDQQCGVVYEITCDDCNKKYISETARTLGTRLKEHATTKRHTTSAIAEHIKDSGHRVKMDDGRILQRQNNTQRRKIKEANQICKKQPTPPPPNRDLGMDIPGIIMKLLLCDPQGHMMSDVRPRTFP